MQGCALFTPAVTRGFGLAQLEAVLKSAMQAAGVEGQPSVLLIEDHHVTSDDILETVNSLLSAGAQKESVGEGWRVFFPQSSYVLQQSIINRGLH